MSIRTGLMRLQPYKKKHENLREDNLGSHHPRVCVVDLVLRPMKRYVCDDCKKAMGQGYVIAAEKKIVCAKCYFKRS